jgi:hypothetical protein
VNDSYLQPLDPIPLDALYLDVNNPRLAPDNPPGYTNPTPLFDPAVQAELEKRAEDSFDLGELEAAMVGQGWMPIDSILVWEHPDVPGKYVVVEGNRRLATIRLRILPRLKIARRRLQKIEDSGGNRLSKQDRKEQEDEIAKLERLVEKTDPLTVLSVASRQPAELDTTLNRILAVRHITGPRDWGSYAEHIWLLHRYEDLFQREFDRAELRWEASVIKQVADEASLGTTKTKRSLRAARAFSHFKRDFEDKLPEGKVFTSADYYLFELLVKEKYPREQFGLGEDAMFLPEEKANVLFDWVFKKPRPERADDNENVFYRHENLQVWGRMKRYDDKFNTSFASRFDVDNPDDAPTMHEVEAEYHAHKAHKQPTSILESLLRQFNELDIETITAEGQTLQLQLQEVSKQSERLLRMVKAAEAE